MSFVKNARDTISELISIYSSSSSVFVNKVQPLRKKYPDAAIPTTSPSNSNTCILECTKLTSDSEGNIIDEETHRKITLKGINVDSAMKLPTSPDLPSHKGCANEYDNIFFDGDNVSFVGRPFPISEAREHFSRIKSWGYNTIRYLVTWEAIEHEGPNKYDEEFIQYTIDILEILGEVGGLYVFLEIHQDVWSRFSGGSGAPMWTLYAAGLQPKRFTLTEAAILHNEPRFHDSSDTYHKMLWTTNYNRLASLVMFSLFFAGRDYFPNLVINDVNIQDYLQQHYLNAVKHIWKAVCNKLSYLIDNGTILGFESMNEPNSGLIGHPHLDEIPKYQQLRVGTTPTAFQTMKLGMGFTCELDTYRIAVTGPQKYGTKIIDPRGQRAWMTPEEAREIDLHYGFNRAKSWKIGECIFIQQEIWKCPELVNTDMTQEQWLDVSSSKCELLQPYFFQTIPNQPQQPIDINYFINNNFMEHYRNFKQTIREISPTVFLFIQPPTLQIPPDVKDDPVIDSKTIYCPHYYDGLSLMCKSWNVKYNVDTLGIMRGRYFNPILGVVIGERAIRNCIRKQFIEIKQECHRYLGKIPVLMSETGMPFDMDNKRAYKSGKYKSQTSALDAICNALEGADMSHTFWCYSSLNCHKHGDCWNNEDFSFWSSDDKSDESGISSANGEIPSDFTRSKSNRNIVNKLAATRMSRTPPKVSVEETGYDSDDEMEEQTPPSQASSMISSIVDSGSKYFPSFDGVRAPSAVIRPYVIATSGVIKNCEFDLKQSKFVLQLTVDKTTSDLQPTVIFVPKWHFIYLNYRDICLTSGKVLYNEALEYLEWYHEEDSTISDEMLIIKRST
ncbi:putative glycosyl hydrolase [Spathaspora sp. JA1]|nr:putative glycosyl hydrolase [Spathaspora sp. JA1]